MNRPQIEQWIEALESGKYQQGEHWLRVAGTFCCLGVACEISGLGRWQPSSAESPEPRARVYQVGHERADRYLPHAVTA